MCNYCNLCYIAYSSRFFCNLIWYFHNKISWLCYLLGSLIVCVKISYVINGVSKLRAIILDYVSSVSTIEIHVIEFNVSWRCKLHCKLNCLYEDTFCNHIFKTKLIKNNIIPNKLNIYFTEETIPQTYYCIKIILNIGTYFGKFED